MGSSRSAACGALPGGQGRNTDRRRPIRSVRRSAGTTERTAVATPIASAAAIQNSRRWSECCVARRSAATRARRRCPMSHSRLLPLRGGDRHGTHRATRRWRAGLARRSATPAKASTARTHPCVVAAGMVPLTVQPVAESAELRGTPRNLRRRPHGLCLTLRYRRKARSGKSRSC